MTRCRRRRARRDDDRDADLGDDDRGADRGAALILVLVLMMAISFLALPMMSYFVAVMKANTVLSEKTRRMEAVRAGFRVALVDPVALYDVCGEAGVTVSRSLATADITGVPVSTECFFVDFASAEDDEALRWGLATTQLGATVPAELSGSRHQASVADDPRSWLDDVTLTSITDRIWLPSLPVHARTPRSATPYRMPVGYPDCNIYYPGTYSDPLVLDGPTYFTSGVYYFEAEVRVVDGADVVVGQGKAGCSNDQEVAFYAENPPTAHHITGQGATWVFGAEGRLVVDGRGTAPIRLLFSQRYVQPEDAGALSSQGVSIMSVNGEVVAGVSTALDVPGLIHVPLSLVGSIDEVIATDQLYRPSVLTPRPAVPGSPGGVVAQPLNGHLRVTWSAPDDDGGSGLAEYQVTVQRVSNPAEVATCLTPPDRRDCTLGGLVNGEPYRVVVSARNDVGWSSPGDVPVQAAPSTGAPAVVPPGSPAVVVVEGFDGAVAVSWSPPVLDGGAPVTSYTVLGSPAGSCTGGYGQTSCVVTGISPLAAPAAYTFTVAATSIAGTSPTSAPSAPVQPSGGPLPAPDPPDQPPGLRVPLAVVDIDVAPGADVVVEVPGYVSVPQGRVRVHNPPGQPVSFRGGLLAASFDVVDGRVGDPPEAGQVPIGFIETVVQRKFRIVSTTTSGRPLVVSTAIVQVNENGAYAINSWEVQ